MHCVKSFQIRIFFWFVFFHIRYLSVFSPNVGKYGPEKTLQAVLIDVGSCPLLTCSNSFLKGLKVPTLESEMDFDQFVIGLFGFFELYSTQIMGYSEVETFTDLLGRYIMKPI